MAKGLSIIPFNDGTEEIVEKMRDKRQNNNCFQNPGLNNYSGTKNPSPKGSFDTLEDKSLQSLVRQAKQEIEEESHERKVIKQNLMTMIFIANEIYSRFPI